MAFIEEEDLVDMLSDTGVEVTWTPAAGDPVTRKGLYARASTPVLDGLLVPERDANPSVQVERAHFAGVQVGDQVTVGGEAWVVRETRIEMRSLLRIYLTQAPVVS